MSTLDANLEITNGFKRLDGNFLGHYLSIMARVTGGTSRIFGDTMPNCGPLLFVTEHKQRYPVTATVSFTYQIAEASGYITDTASDYSFQKVAYTGVAGIYSGTITITGGERDYSQHLYNTHPFIRNIQSLSIDDETQGCRVYCLGDDGSRLLYGANHERIRDLEDILSRGLWVSPRKCILCDGTGVYNGTVCTDCNGYKYVGRNAETALLNDRAKDVVVVRRAESENSMQYRAWARKWWTVPTKDEIKRYFGHFLKTNTGNITIEEYYSPEAYWVIRYPEVGEGALGVGSLLSISGTTLQNIAQQITPAGTNAILETYYLFTDDSAIHDYCHDFSSVPHTVAVTPSFGFIFPIIQDGWNNASFGSEFGGDFADVSGYYDNYTGTVSGIIFYNTSYITKENVEEIYLYDKFFTLSGEEYT